MPFLGKDNPLANNPFDRPDPLAHPEPHQEVGQEGGHMEEKTHKSPFSGRDYLKSGLGAKKEAVEKEETPEMKEIKRAELKKALGKIQDGFDIKMKRAEREGVIENLEKDKYGREKVNLEKIEKKYLPGLKKEISHVTYQEGLDIKHEMNLWNKVLKKLRGK